MRCLIKTLLISLCILLGISIVLNHAKSIPQKYSEYPSRLCIVNSKIPDSLKSQEIVAITSDSIYSLIMTNKNSSLKVNHINDFTSYKLKDCTIKMKYVPNKEDNLNNVCLSTLSNSIYTNYELCRIIKASKGDQ